MACNTCAKPFSLLRKEKGCPGCGFSYCSKCLNEKIFLPKLNTEAKVCAKCKRGRDKESNEPKKIEPPDAYYKRLGAQDTKPSCSNAEGSAGSSTANDEIQKRLLKLKEDRKPAAPPASEDETANRLNKLKGELPQTSDAELQERLARLRGVPVSTLQTKEPILPMPDLRTEQEQADDLMKQYMEQASVDNKYKNEFDDLVNAMESRLNNLKGSETSAKDTKKGMQLESAEIESEDEEDAVRRIIEKVKADPSLQDDDEIPSSTNDELPFCEICNEDARMRCLGCKYLFCKRCFLDHKDDDDGCNRYEPYTPPKSK